MYATQGRMLLRRSKVVDLEVDTGNRRTDYPVRYAARYYAFNCDTDFSRKNQEFFEQQNGEQLDMARGRTSYRIPYPAKHYCDSDANTFYLTDRPAPVYERAVTQDQSLQHNVHYEQEHREHRDTADLQQSDAALYYHEQEPANYERKHQEFHQDPNFQLTNNIRHGLEAGAEEPPTEPGAISAGKFYNDQDATDYSRKTQEFSHDPQYVPQNNVHYYRPEQPVKQGQHESKAEFIYGAPDERDGQYIYAEAPSSQNQQPLRRSISGQDPVVPLPRIQKCGQKHDNPVFAEKSERICLYKKRNGWM